MKRRRKFKKIRRWRNASRVVSMTMTIKHAPTPATTKRKTHANFAGVSSIVVSLHFKLVQYLQTSSQIETKETNHDCIDDDSHQTDKLGVASSISNVHFLMAGSDRVSGEKGRGVKVDEPFKYARRARPQHT